MGTVVIVDGIQGPPGPKGDPGDPGDGKLSYFHTEATDHNPQHGLQAECHGLQFSQ